MDARHVNIYCNHVPIQAPPPRGVLSLQWVRMTRTGRWRADCWVARLHRFGGVSRKGRAGGHPSLWEELGSRVVRRPRGRRARRWQSYKWYGVGAPSAEELEGGLSELKDVFKAEIG